MTQEYLFTTDDNKEEIEQLEVADKISKELRTIDNSTCWILSFTIDSENEEAAKKLDSVNSLIIGKYNPTILSNESSAYFNKSLFPIINEFERKLRKLLYLASALQGDNTAKSVIINLESEDLGKIFETLFSDSTFVKSVKEKINQKTWQFTRNELLAAIKEIDENTLWDVLLGYDCAKTLCDHFSELKAYRNDVMHAHNISFAQFRSAKQLFKKVNEELDSAIGNLIGAKEENETVVSTDFNTALSSALLSMRSQIDTSGLERITEMLKNILPEPPVINPEIVKALSELGKFTYSEYTIDPKVSEALSDIQKMMEIKNDITPATNALKELSKQFESYKIVTPPEIAELERKLSDIDFDGLSDDNDVNENDSEEQTNG